MLSRHGEYNVLNRCKEYTVLSRHREYSVLHRCKEYIVLSRHGKRKCQARRGDFFLKLPSAFFLKL